MEPEEILRRLRLERYQPLPPRPDGPVLGPTRSAMEAEEWARVQERRAVLHRERGKVKVDDDS